MEPDKRVISSAQEIAIARYEAILHRIASPILDELRNPRNSPHSHEKRRVTVVAIVATELVLGKFDFPDFWKRPDIASIATYKKYRKHDGNFVTVLDRVRELKTQARDEASREISEQAFASLLSAAPKAVNKLILLMEEAESETVQLNAARDVLDRNPYTARNRTISIKEDSAEKKPHVLTEEEKQAKLQEIAIRLQAEMNRK